MLKHDVICRAMDTGRIGCDEFRGQEKVATHDVDGVMTSGNAAGYGVVYKGKMNFAVGPLPDVPMSKHPFTCNVELPPLRSPATGKMLVCK